MVPLQAEKISVLLLHTLFINNKPKPFCVYLVLANNYYIYYGIVHIVYAKDLFLMRARLCAFIAKCQDENENELWPMILYVHNESVVTRFIIYTDSYLCLLAIRNYVGTFSSFMTSAMFDIEKEKKPCELIENKIITFTSFF